MKRDELLVDEVPYLYDDSGRIYIKGDKVYRIIEKPNHINNYKELLNAYNIEDIFDIGLVRTKISEESNAKGLMILEHQKIPFILHPCEYSNKMFWQAAYMFIELNLKLWELGFVTHDSHPWNISFDGTKPVFYDFGSIVKKNNVSQAWFDEFFYGFIIPIWLASNSKTFKLSKEYRREHGSGFGLELFKSYKLKNLFFRRVRGISKYKNDPKKLFNEILKWLTKHKPISVNQEFWSNYYQSTGMDYTAPTSIKQKFVYEILSKTNPQKVLDLASNKGYYTFMAAHLGASVLAFDYEEEIVNHLLRSEDSRNVTPVHMDFNKPTSGLGPGLFWENSFTRFKSEIILALGLIHHICITQQIPVFLFCQTVKKYAIKGVILEFVDPEDIHVASWNKSVPKDYSLEKIKYFMSDKFPNCRTSDFEKEDGLSRTFLYFYV